MKEYLATKQQYLQHRCIDQYCLKKQDWWFSITITPLLDIPECTNCKNDTLKLKHSLGHDVQVSCCQHCLWYEWFDFRRKNHARNHNKTLVYFYKKNKDGKNYGLHMKMQ